MIEPKIDEFVALIAFQSGGVLPIVGLASVTLATLECVGVDVPLSLAESDRQNGRVSRRLIIPVGNIRSITPLTYEEVKICAESIDWRPLPEKITPADAPDTGFPF